MTSDGPPPDLPPLPFAPAQLRLAMAATHHSGWDMTPEQKAVILGEIEVWTDELYKERRVDFRSRDGAKGRALWELLPALYLAGMEAGGRLTQSALATDEDDE